jgi:hypothetical protein
MDGAFLGPATANVPGGGICLSCGSRGPGAFTTDGRGAGIVIECAGTASGEPEHLKVVLDAAQTTAR